MSTIYYVFNLRKMQFLVGKVAPAVTYPHRGSIRSYKLWICCFRSHERTPDDLEIIYEELLHIRALTHLSNSVKREIASVVVFEAHSKAGTVCKCHHN